MLQHALLCCNMLPCATFFHIATCASFNRARVQRRDERVCLDSARAGACQRWPLEAVSDMLQYRYSGAVPLTLAYPQPGRCRA